MIACVCGGAGFTRDSVEGAGSVDEVDGFERVAVAVAIVVECVRPFADDGIDAEVGTADGGGARIDVDGDADGVVGAAVAVVDVGIEGVGMVDGLEWVAVVVAVNDVRAFAGDGVRTEVEGVRPMMKGRSTLRCV